MKKLLILYLCLITLGQGFAAESAVERRLQRLPRLAGLVYAPEPQGKITEAISEQSVQTWLSPRLFRLGPLYLVHARISSPVRPSPLLLKRTSSKVQMFRSVFGTFQPEDWGLCGFRLPRADG